MAGLWRAYLRVLEKHPWKTQITSTATLMSIGDVIAQTVIEGKTKDYSIIRTARFCFFGTIFVGPALRTWYLTMEKMFGASKNAAVFKLIADQGCFAPVFLTCFISGMEALKGNSWQKIKNKVAQDILLILWDAGFGKTVPRIAGWAVILVLDFKPVLTTNYKVWPAVQICNFYFIPIQHRILVVNITALGWNTYLASKSNAD